MKFAIVLFALVAAAQAAEEDVVVLNAANFDELTKASDAMMIEFYAPWCGHCKRLAPEYADAAGTLKGVASLAKVDCTDGDNKDVCSRFGVRGYPTVKWFSEGGAKNEPYEGARTAAGIAKWIKKKVGAGDIDAVADEAAVKEAAAKGITVAFYGAGVAKSEAVKAAAGKLADSIAVVACDACAGAEVNVFVDGKHLSRALTADADLDSWLDKATTPLVGDFDGNAYKSLVAKKKYVVFVLCEAQPCGDSDMAPALANAESAPDNIGFLRMGGAQSKRVGSQLGFTGSYPNVIAVHKPDGGREQLFQHDGAYDADSVKQWLADLGADKIARKVKSEDVPTDNAPGKVWKVVSTTVASDVLNADADVFLKIYAPWCGHCKSMAPAWEQLAELYKENPKIRIAELDGTQNDFDLPSTGYPTLYWVKKGEAPVQYQGGRDFDAFKAFVEKSSGFVAKDEL